MRAIDKISVPDDLAVAETTDFATVWKQQIGDEQQLRMLELDIGIVVEILDGVLVERSEAPAEGKQFAFRQTLAAKQQQWVFLPLMPDGFEIPIAEVSQIDIEDLRAEIV